MGFFGWLFDTSGFPPRWTCGWWSDELGWLHILSDLGVWAAYLAIPCVLGYFILRRKDLPFRKIFLLFGAFILACGTTHLMEAIIFWHPVYRLAGVIKLATAVVSWATVIALIPTVPKVLAMRSPEELEREIAAREKAEGELQRANDELERRIEERTAELVNQERQLREKIREIATLMDVAPVAIVTTYDPACRTVTGNRAASELLGVPSGGNVSKSAPPDEQPPFRVFRNGAEAPAPELAVQVAAAQGIDVRDEEQELRFVDGRVRHIVCHASPLFDDRGQVRGCVGAVLDVTEQKRAELALKEADRRKNEFLATLAHELRNPLAPISNGLQVLRLANGDRATFERVGAMMDRQLHQLVRLVDDLLDMSRITRGAIELRKERLLVSTIVDVALETSQPFIEGAKHEVAIDIPREPLWVDGDLTRLAQVVSNLLNNSVKYTPEGGRLRLAVERNDNQAVIRVRDNGIGIPASMLPHVFDAFARADRPASRSRDGLGIGLSLVRRLVEMHGGHVEACSAGTDQGSEFVVRLPLAASQPPAPGAAPSASTPAAPGRALRILVVDDSDDSAESLRVLLELLGHNVRTAHSGTAALECAREFRPEVAFLDIGMPGMSGHEVAQRIRQMPELKGIILVAQTGWGQEEDRRRSAAAGFDHHLVKPVDFAALQNVLSAV